MCGIAGWTAFDQDLTCQSDVLDAMTATMACRGPDAGGVHLQKHAALGHRRLAVIDIAGGGQPMTAEEDGRPLAVLTFSGEIYNHRELRAELEARGQRFRSRSDTEVVLRAYLEWGPGFVDRLNGMYGFAIWDQLTEELLLARDRMGVKPLYYHPTPSGVIFGSEPKAILAHPAVRPDVDRDGLRELIAMTRTPGHAVYRGMHEVLPGHIVRVRRTGLTVHRYWALEAREHTDDLDTTIAVVRSLLKDTVQRQLIADVPLCTLLSGGLDSSAITALAAQGLRDAGAGPVRSFAVDFADHARHFRPDSLRPSQDTPYARMLAEHVGAEHTEIVLDSAELAERRHCDAALRARDLPNGLGDFDTSLLLLFRAVRKHSTVALSGESADELFGGYHWFHNPATVSSEGFPWFATMQELVGRETLLDPGLLAELDLAAYRRDRYHQALGEVPHVDGASPEERRMREICYLNLTRFVQILLDRKDRMSMATGLEVRVPFCDHRLVQYVFNTPWSMKTFDGREKSLLRAAVRDVLPPAVADRVKSPYPSTEDPRYHGALQARLGELARDNSSPAHALLAPAALRDIDGRDSRTARCATELVLALDTWLRDQPISLRV